MTNLLDNDNKAKVMEGAIVALTERVKALEALVAAQSAPTTPPKLTEAEHVALADRITAAVAPAPAQEETAVAGIIPNGTFTVSKDDARHTYKIATQKDNANFAPGQRIVSVLNGPDNWSNYKGFGFVSKDGKRVHIWKSKKSGKTDAMATQVEYLATPEKLEDYGYAVQASSKCLRCNRKLTVPSSITAGFGPVCVEMVA